MGTVIKTVAVTAVASAAVASREEGDWERVLCEAYKMTRKVMMMFWMVRKKFSPYVEKGNLFLNE